MASNRPSINELPAKAVHQLRALIATQQMSCCVSNDSKTLISRRLTRGADRSVSVFANRVGSTGVLSKEWSWDSSCGLCRRAAGLR